MMIKYLLSIFLFGFLASCSNQQKYTVSPQEKNIDQGFSQTKATPKNKQQTCAPPKKFIKQVILGYQGWFSAKGDGVNNEWNHWSPYSMVPAPGNVRFELYPDVSEYKPSDLYPTRLGNLRNGKTAKLFSSARDGVVDLHFKWMKNYGLDGIALQRFSNDLKKIKQRKHRNKVTQLVKKYAKKHCRTFYIMYDITATPKQDLVSLVKQDWIRVMENTLHIVDSSQYSRYYNKPVIGLWGFGFNTPSHQYSKKQALELISWFQNKGFYVVGGVPYNFRLGQHDSRKNWSEIYNQFDMLLPWSVGRYRDNIELNHHFKTIWKRDLAYIRRNKMEMKRVIFPGFAWSNWNKGQKNQIPRRRGKFLWKQAYLTNQLGLGAFIAMFDEYDEGTAIAKTAINQSMIPNNQYFLTLSEDGHQLESDFYLRLASKITQLIHSGKEYPF